MPLMKGVTEVDHVSAIILTSKYGPACEKALER